ncbi:MAG: pilus assembly protein PilM [Clostridiales bacterium]|nr:pilus assembly protein PilM [Clostridiales bacterium]
MFGKNVLALDIGSKFIKAVYGSSLKSGADVKEYAMLGTPRAAVYDGCINDIKSITEVISGFMKGKSIKANSMITGIGGKDIVTRHIELPHMTEKQVKKAARLEIQQYLPINTDEYAIDSKTIEKGETSNGKMLDVLVAAVPKKKVEGYMALAKGLGLKLKFIDLFADSISRIFAGSGEFAENKTIATADMGYNSISVTLIQNGNLFLERQIDTGDFGTYTADCSAKYLADQLIDNMMKVINFYISNSYNRKIDSIYLYGEGAGIKGMADYIKRNTRSDVKLLGPELLHGIRGIDEGLKEKLYLYINCISLLLRRN